MGVVMVCLRILLSVIVFSCVAACISEKASLPPAIATVNGEAISLAEFEMALTEETALVGGEVPLKAEETETLKEAVLDKLIRDRLMLQRARDLSLFIGEAELVARIEEIRKDYNGQFGKQFGDDGIDLSAWKEELRKRILLEKLIALDVNAKIQVTDEEAERYFNVNRKEYVTDRRVHVAQIVVPNLERAERILKRLKAGEDFGMVAREVSIGPEAVRGGDLGFFEPGVMPETIDRIIFSLPVGKISRVAQSPYGFHIFKVLGQEKAGGRIFADVREKVISDLRKRREAEVYRAWIDGLRAVAVIRIDRPLPGGLVSAGAEVKSSPPVTPERH